jgi:hypothetical protein
MTICYVWNLTKGYLVNGLKSRMQLKDLVKLSRGIFRCLQERRWTDATTAMETIPMYAPLHGEEWISGYMNALQGMLVALRTSQTTQDPFILTVNTASLKTLNALKTRFYDKFHSRLDADFDQGFYHTWYEYVKFVIEQEFPS